tara:strand:+ start:17733 stop:18731 length:999 start_codon:yes stop_codon:yes gene_type:complete
MTDLNKKLEDISKQVYEGSPEIKEIIDQVSDGVIDETEAMELMMKAVMANSGELNTTLTKFANEAMAQAESELRETNPALFQAPSGLPKLDPMFEARLYERIQFDEDAPELRVGPLPKGVKPAVPVADAPVSPVALGASLKTASEKMDDEIKQLLATGSTNETSLTPAGFANVPQPVNYQPGQLPALINVATPTGGDLAALTVPEQQELAWSSAVTTQGRRSAAKTIQRLICENLQDIGFDVQAREMQPEVENVILKPIWTFSMLGGAENTQSNFSPIANASASILNEIVSHYTNENGMIDISQKIWFEITTVDIIDERRVGWASLIRKRLS